MIARWLNGMYISTLKLELLFLPYSELTCKVGCCVSSLLLNVKESVVKGFWQAWGRIYCYLSCYLSCSLGRSPWAKRTIQCLGETGMVVVVVPLALPASWAGKNSAEWGLQLFWLKFKAGLLSQQGARVKTRSWAEGQWDQMVAHSQESQFTSRSIG